MKPPIGPAPRTWENEHMNRKDPAHRRQFCRALGVHAWLGTVGWGVSVFAKQAQAAVIEGVSFEPHLQLWGTDLVLNGVGVRAVAWIKGYAAALYLTKRSQQAEGAIAAPGPKRLRLHMLMEVPAAEFSKAFDKGVRRNVSPAQLPGLQSRIELFEEVIQSLKTVRKGDLIDLDFDPTRGLVLQLNGTLHGQPVAGADFYAALLRSFIGEQPYDKALRSGLLGANA
jgi:Chalcone isomerase-like